MIRALVALALLVLVAGARPAAAETVILVDVPPSVEAALRTTLEPWKVAVIVVAPAPVTYQPAKLAADRGAAYVAWRRGEELVLYDAALAEEERRPMARSPDDAEAASIALSIKTWMGLGPAPAGPTPCGPRGCPSRRARPWLVEVAAGVRVAAADQPGAGFRYGLAGGHRRGRLEAGLRLDLGVDRDGTAFGSSGSWSVLVVGAWGRAVLRVRPALELLPEVGVGVIHTGVRTVRTGPGGHDDEATASGLALDGGVGARWRRGALAVGVRVGLTLVPGAQTLEVRSLDEPIDAHVEPWTLATIALAL